MAEASTASKPAAASKPAGPTKRAGGKKERQSNIEGVLRIRPIKPGETPCLVANEQKGFTISLDGAHYGEDTFSAVLGSKVSQHDVFLTVGQPIIESMMRGERACLFAYGQTGSGKTYSMYGADGGKNPSKLNGSVPTICAELFRKKQELERRNGAIKMTITATLVEVRGDQIVDLIAEPLPGPAGGQPWRKLVDGVVMDAHEEMINGTRHLTDMIERGMSRRTTGANIMHANSSRSHAFLTVYVDKQTGDGEGKVKKERTCMHLIDLAGSEKFAAGDDSAGKNSTTSYFLLPTSYFLLPTSYFLLPTSYWR